MPKPYQNPLDRKRLRKNGYTMKVVTCPDTQAIIQIPMRLKQDDIPASKTSQHVHIYEGRNGYRAKVAYGKTGSHAKDARPKRWSSK